jgi:hypothetical protein
MWSQVVAKWLVDGFLHPPATLKHEFVDVDEFLRVPIAGLPDVVQFALVAVDSSSVLVFGEASQGVRSVLQDSLADRYPNARRVYLDSASPGVVNVQGASLTEIDACAVAVIQYRQAWDESQEIHVRDGAFGFLVTVTCEDEKYSLSVRSS